MKYKNIKITVLVALMFSLISLPANAHGGEGIFYTFIGSFGLSYLIQIMFLILAHANRKTRWLCGVVIGVTAVSGYWHFFWAAATFFEEIAIFVLLSILSWGVMLYLLYFQKPKAN